MIRGEHFIEVPLVARAGPSETQLIGIGPAEHRAPLPDRLVGDHDAALEHQFLHITQAQREAVIQSHGVADEFWAVITVTHHPSGHQHSQGDDARSNVQLMPNCRWNGDWHAVLFPILQ
ncbi:hypothetical protein AS032_32375 [Rhodococcus qingshengii]|nr:hypothetical protein AOT96_30900 [Rhodococcus sp. 008]ARE37715.1 hypothetical protein A0W34_29725 [Rhodococcus sp. BH4]KDQ00435.1 hypothetical protein EN35_33375 [Rhodococcus qingshengii]KSU65801.1 hypothetical protein AS032_32375 [Rhodococcus qingshengii]KZF14487.1 hypothetical protein A2J01_33660 [Rhodococcus sp. EPR-134]